MARGISSIVSFVPQSRLYADRQLLFVHLRPFPNPLDEEAEVEFEAIASEVLTALEKHDIRAIGLAISFTYSAAEFDAAVAAGNVQPVLNRQLDFRGQRADVEWSIYIHRAAMDSESNLQPGILRLPEDPLATDLTLAEKRLIEATLGDLHHLFKEYVVPFTSFQVDLVLSGAEFDLVFPSKADTPVLGRGVRHRISLPEGQGALQIVRAIGTTDLGLR